MWPFRRRGHQEPVGEIASSNPTDPEITEFSEDEVQYWGVPIHFHRDYRSRVTQRSCEIWDKYTCTRCQWTITKYSSSEDFSDKLWFHETMCPKRGA